MKRFLALWIEIFNEYDNSKWFCTTERMMFLLYSIKWDNIWICLNPKVDETLYTLLLRILVYYLNYNINFN